MKARLYILMMLLLLAPTQLHANPPGGPEDETILNELEKGAVNEGGEVRHELKEKAIYEGGEVVKDLENEVLYRAGKDIIKGEGDKVVKDLGKKVVKGAGRKIIDLGRRGLNRVGRKVRSTTNKVFDKVVNKGFKAGINYFLPGVGDTIGAMLGLGSVEDQVERVEEKVNDLEELQNTGIDQLREIAKQARETDAKVEKANYYQKQTRDNAQLMMSSRGKAPSNSGPPSGKMTANEILQGTRADMIDDDLEKMSISEFKKKLKEAEAHEKKVLLEVAATEKKQLKFYEKEKARLNSDIKDLEKSKKMKGVTTEAVLAMEQTIEIKKQALCDVHERLEKAKKEATNLTGDQGNKMLNKMVKTNDKEFRKRWADHRKKRKAKHRHLFW